MAGKAMVAVIGLTVLLLLGAVAIPAMQSASSEQQTVRLSIDEGDSAGVTTGLNATVVNTTQTDGTIRVTDTETGVTDNLTMPEGDTVNYTLPGGNGSVTLVTANPNDATIDARHSPTYGFGSSATAFVDELGLILVAMLFLVVMASVKVVIA